LLQEIVLTADLAPMAVSEAEAKAFQHQHGDNAVIERKDGALFVHILKGSTLYIPKALRHDRLVAGQVPTGWDAKLYGIPEDIIKQVDRVTLYTLVSTAEALICSGITDPYEFYQYVHLSEVGNSSGGGLGGVDSVRAMYHVRLLFILI
jgi:fatty acid synthase subunit alpha, fungi type